MNWQEFNNLVNQLTQNSGIINIQLPPTLLTDFDNRLTALSNNFTDFDNRLTALSNNFTNFDNRLTALSDNFTNLDNRLTALSNNFTNLDNRLTTLDNRLRVGNDRPTSNTPPADYYLARNYNEIWHHNGSQWILVSRDPGRYIDLTNATSDYFLQRGEVAIIQVHDVPQKPLRIATESGTAYEMWVINYNKVDDFASGWGPIFLLPNNTAYTNTFGYIEMNRVPEGFYSWYGNYTAYRIGWAYSNSYCQIVNFTQYKNVKGFYEILGRPDFVPCLYVVSSTWRDTTTPWTSLGTITWPQASRAYIIVRRVL